VLEISRLALKAHLRGRSLAPALGILYPLATTSREQNHCRAPQGPADLVVVLDAQAD
jgi:hypothetical protein